MILTMNILPMFIFALPMLMIISLIDAVTLMDGILNVTYNHSLIRFAFCDNCQLNYHMFDTGAYDNVTFISHHSWTQDKFRIPLPPKNVDVLCGDNMSSHDMIQQRNHRKQSASWNDEESNHTHFEHKIDFDDAFLVRARIGRNCTLNAILRNIHSSNQQSPVKIRYLILPERYLGVAFNHIKMAMNDLIPISRQFRLLPSTNKNKTISFNVYNIPNLLFLPQDSFDDLDSFINVNHKLNQLASPYFLDERNARWDLFYKISEKSTGPSSKIHDIQNIILQQSDDKSDEQQQTKAGKWRYFYIPVSVVWFIVLCTICCYKVSSDREKLELMAANRRREVELNRLQRSMNNNAESERIGLTREEFDSLPLIYYHSNIIITFTGVDMSMPTVPTEKMDAGEVILDMMKQPDHSVAEALLHNDDHSAGYANEDSTTKVIESDVENNRTLDHTNQSNLDPNPVLIEADHITTTNLPLPERMDSISDGACPVCVEDFQENELIIRLPKCRHLYHIQCIEMWLVGKKSDFCPLCKEVVLEQKVDEVEEDTTNHEVLDRSDLNA